MRRKVGVKKKRWNGKNLKIEKWKDGREGREKEAERK